MKIFLLTDKDAQLSGERVHGKLFGYSDKELFSIGIKTEIKNNFTYKYLEKGIDYCKVKDGDSPFDALFEYGAIYSEHKMLKIESNFF